MTRAEAVAASRRKLAEEMSEAEWQGWVVTTARRFGWLAYHPYDSRRSEAGFPDLVLVRDDMLVFAELKRERGNLTGAQQAWLAALAGPAGLATNVQVHVWRPSQLDEVLELLR